jgi:hypothetical protein
MPWSAAHVAYSLIRPKSQISNIRHDGTLSNRNFILKMKKPKNLGFEPVHPKNVLFVSVVHGISCLLEIIQYKYGRCLAHGDWSSLSSEPSKSWSSSIHLALTNSPQTSSRWFALFLSFRIFLAGQQSKLTEKLKKSDPNMFLVMNEPEEQEFSLKKIKISAYSEKHV